MSICVLFNAVIFLLCSAAGYMHAYDYHCRTVNLQSFLYAMKYLEDEVIYKKTPLPEAVKTLGYGKCSNGARLLFQAVAEDFDEKASFGAKKSFEESWCTNIKEMSEKTALMPQDTEILEEIGKMLGGSDYLGQKSIFERSGEQLSQLVNEAKEAENTKGKMYKGLGMAAGLLIAVLLM